MIPATLLVLFDRLLELGADPRDGVDHPCGCPAPRTLQISPSTLQQGPIWCGLCGEPFADRGGE